MQRLTNQGKFRWSLVLAFVVMVLALAGTVTAQTGAGFDLSWHTIANGGGTSTGGGFSLSGTAGQAAVGPLLEAGGYALSGGYWEPGSKIFLPTVIH